MPVHDDILTFEDSQSALGLEPSDLYHWVSEGRLRAYRMDPDVRFRVSDLDSLLARRKAQRGRNWVGLDEACELSGYDRDRLMQFMIDGAVSAYRSDRDIYFRKDEMRLLRMAGENGGGLPAGNGDPAPDPNATVTLDEAAERSQLSRWELAKLVDTGELAPVEPSAKMVFRRSEVEALCAQRAATDELAAAGDAGEALLKLSSAVGFRFGPGGTSSTEAILDRIRSVAREHGLTADTLEDLITGLEGLAAQDAADQTGD